MLSVYDRNQNIYYPAWTIYTSILCIQSIQFDGFLYVVIVVIQYTDLEGVVYTLISPSVYAGIWQECNIKLNHIQKGANVFAHAPVIY